MAEPRKPDPQVYPKWLYHATKPATLVENEKEEKALGGGWYDNPAKAKPPVQPPTPQEQIAAAKAAEDKAAADKAKTDADAKARADAVPKPSPTPVK